MTNEMTAEEAVEILKYERDNDIFVATEYREKLHEALTKAIQALEAQPCEDCISREEAINEADNLSLETSYDNEKVEQMLRDLPPVKPQYTDEEIDKAQAVEQAYVDKMVELAVEESRKKWLNSFDTSSATKCFEAVNLLKQRLEGEE